MPRVAVYGSLRRGFGNHPLIEGEMFEGTAVISHYKMYSLGPFPGIVPYEDGEIFSEIYFVSDEKLRELDRLEGHPTFYRRVQIQTRLGVAWIYELSSPEHYSNCPLVSSGEWGKK